MPEVLRSDAADAALARAVQANLADLNYELARSPATESLRRPGFFRWRTRVPHALYNGVVCSAPPGADAAALVHETVEFFRARGPASIIWWFEAGIDRAPWAAPLAGHGFAFKRDLPGMAAPVSALVLPRALDLEIRRVETRADRETWARTFVQGYGFPLEWAPDFADLFGGLDTGGAYSSWLAFERGEPVATSTMLLSSGVAGIYDVATLPAARGRGIGSAVTLAPLVEAAKQGWPVGVLQASTQGTPMYHRMGFRTVCHVEYFEWKDGGAQ